jgi:hypothetical protein
MTVNRENHRSCSYAGIPALFVWPKTVSLRLERHSNSVILKELFLLFQQSALRTLTWLDLHLCKSLVIDGHNKVAVFS